MTSGSLARLTRVWLRRGTRYRVIEADGLSEGRVLERGVEVEVRRLACTPDEVAMYVLDDDVLLVAFEDEVRVGGTW